MSKLESQANLLDLLQDRINYYKGELEHVKAERSKEQEKERFYTLLERELILTAMLTDLQNKLEEGRG